MTLLRMPQKQLEVTKAKKECFLNGKRIHYDEARKGSLEEAIAFYGNDYEYIGTTRIIYINDICSEHVAPYHHFRYKPKED